MDNELRQYLDEMKEEMKLDLSGQIAAAEERLSGRIAAVEAYTSGQIAAVEERLSGRIDAVEERLSGRIDAAKAHTSGQIDAVEERLKDLIRAADHEMETKIVGEFWKWGRTSDMRTREALTHTAALAERMLAVEDRVSALERRPAA